MFTIQTKQSRAKLRRLVAGFSQRRPRIDPKSGHVGFVVDELPLGRVFSEYSAFPCQFTFHWLLHIDHHLSSGAGAIGQIVTYVPSGLTSLTPPQEIKTKLGKADTRIGGQLHVPAALPPGKSPPVPIG
jgi:hypothetical protein